MQLYILYISLFLFLVQNFPLLAVATQNGHVTLWDARSGTRLATVKMHTGSIEGLQWHPLQRCLATAGADCVVHLLDVAQTV